MTRLPELKRDRSCSLDCSNCHVSPAGGGLRTPSGQFYGREELPTWGPRPSARAAPGTPPAVDHAPRLSIPPPAG